jgi:chromate reductase, NAD(P)H dehydrogenase (quinone)
MIKILAISGSLRSQSSSTGILQAIQELASNRMNVLIYTGISNLPHFNPDLDQDQAIVSVIEWRTQLQNCDGVLFCTPEYARGVPGVLKNALDWIVSSGEFMHKPTTVISVSPSSDGGDKANASLVQTLNVMMAEIVETLSIPAISVKLNSANKISDPITELALKSILNRLFNTINGIDRV